MGQRHIIRDKKKPSLKNTGATVEKRPKRSGKEKPEIVTYTRPGRDDDFIVPRVNEPTRDVYDKLRKWKTELKKVLEISQQRLVKGQLEPWDETKARCKPTHMKKRQSRNLRYINGRHFTGDRYASSKWDFHYYAVKRYIHENVPMCGDPDNPKTWCEYCDDMSDGARRTRWNLYQKLRLIIKNGGEASDPKKWATISDIVTDNADCRWMNTNRGMMHEEYEHPLLDSSFPLPPLRLRECDVGTQTMISTFVNAPHPDKPNTVVDLTDSPPCGHYTRIYDPNVECERFIHPEYITLYNNMVRIDKSNDPGRMLLSPLADKAFKLLANKMDEDYDYAMKHRAELLMARSEDSTEEKLQWLEDDPVLNDFKKTYFDRSTRPKAANVLGQDSVDIWVTKKGELPKIENVTADHILQFQMDGQAFDATRCTRLALLKYHLKWLKFYREQLKFNENPNNIRELEMQAPAFPVPSTTINTGWIAQELLPVTQDTVDERNRAPFQTETYKRFTTTCMQVTEEEIQAAFAPQQQPDDGAANKQAAPTPDAPETTTVAAENDAASKKTAATKPTPMETNNNEDKLNTATSTANNDNAETSNSAPSMAKGAVLAMAVKNTTTPIDHLDIVDIVPNTTTSTETKKNDDDENKLVIYHKHRDTLTSARTEATLIISQWMPNYLTWDYSEKFRDAVQIMIDRNAKVTPSTIALTPHRHTSPI